MGQKHKEASHNWLYIILWSVLAVAIGILLTIYVFKPMYYQASVFSGGLGTKGGLEKAETQLAYSGVSTERSIIKVILGWVNFALPFAGLFAFVGIVYAGFLYVVNFANEELANKAKTIIFMCIIGLIIIFSAYAIVSTIIGASSA